MTSNPLDPSQKSDETDFDEEANRHHNGSEEAGLGLLQARHAITGSGDSNYFGPERETARIGARELQLRELPKEAVASIPQRQPSFTGGEHDVWLLGEPVTDVLKMTLPGFYGRILDEKDLFDSRTFQNRRQLFMRAALPCEYLLRWAVLNCIFKLPTRYQGQVPNGTSEPNMAITQPYVRQDENDQPEAADVIALMEANDFVKVDGTMVANPEIKEVTWYRVRDGILITDAHPRNFRKDIERQILVPIDLVVTVVPPNISKLLPNPQMPWKFPGSPTADTTQ